MTFNDEVACRKTIQTIDDRPLRIKGAVQATTLMAVLEKLEDDELKLQENDAGELEFRGKGKGFCVNRDAEVFLPIDRVDKPKDWKKLPTDFAEAIEKVRQCVSADETKFTLTCVHLHPHYLESCDNHQLLRYKLKMGLEESILVRGNALSQITTLGMDYFSVTKTWIHFKNPSGLVYSCRKYAEEYPPLDTIMDFDGRPITIPKGMAPAAERAAIFADDKGGDPLLLVTVVPGKIRLKGIGVAGRYWEVKKLAYDGPAMNFMIRPNLLHDISEKRNEGFISKGKLKATGDKWVYVTVLGKAEAREEKETKDSKAED